MTESYEASNTAAQTHVKDTLTTWSAVSHPPPSCTGSRDLHRLHLSLQTSPLLGRSVSPIDDNDTPLIRPFCDYIDPSPQAPTMTWTSDSPTSLTPTPIGITSMDEGRSTWNGGGSPPTSTTSQPSDSTMVSNPPQTSSPQTFEITASTSFLGIGPPSLGIGLPPSFVSRPGADPLSTATAPSDPSFLSTDQSTGFTLSTIQSADSTLEESTALFTTVQLPHSASEVSQALSTVQSSYSTLEGPTTLSTLITPSSKPAPSAHNEGSDEHHRDEGLNRAAIGGIVVSTTVVLVLAIGVIWWKDRKKRKAKNRRMMVARVKSLRKIREQYPQRLINDEQF